MAGVRVEIAGLSDFRRRLRGFAPEVDKMLQRRFKTILSEIIDDARGKASWSTRIPRTIRSSVTRRGFAIRAGGGTAPHARSYELGSKGSTSMLRHPVFGNRDVWVEQPVRPFLFPSVDAHRGDALDGAAAAVQDAIRTVGWI